MPAPLATAVRAQREAIAPRSHPSEVEADRMSLSSTGARMRRLRTATGARAATWVAAGPGVPLDAATRHPHEARMGHDLRHVRVHTGEAAAASARALGARAYAVGSRIVFGAGEYVPRTEAGRRLLAHELTHVAQNDGFGATPAAGLARAPLPPGVETPPPALHPEARADLLARFRALVESLSPEAYDGLQRYGTLAIGVVSDERGMPRLVYTTNQSRGGTELAAKARALGLVWWNAQPEAGGRGAVGAPGDAEQLMIQQARAMRWVVEAMVVSRKVCPDCQVVVRTYRQGRITVIEVPLPELATGESPVGKVQLPAGPTAATPAAAAGETSAPTPVESTVQANVQVTKSLPAAGDQVVSEVTVKLGSGLEPVNKAIAGTGGKPIPEQVVLRVVVDAAGRIVAVDSPTPGVPPEIAEMLGRQAIRILPGAGPKMTAAEGVGFGLTLVFLVKAGYDVGSAPEGQRARVASRHVGGFAGGMAAGYLVCNLVLGLPTGGWSLLICGLAAGVPGGMAGSAAADVAYEESTINDNEIRAWVAGHDLVAIGRLPVLTKAGYVITLMHGWISGADVTAMERICAAVATAAEMRVLRTMVEPRITTMSDIGQRTRLRLALDRL